MRQISQECLSVHGAVDVAWANNLKLAGHLFAQHHGYRTAEDDADLVIYHKLVQSPYHGPRVKSGLEAPTWLCCCGDGPNMAISGKHQPATTSMVHHLVKDCSFWVCGASRILEWHILEHLFPSF